MRILFIEDDFALGKLVQEGLEKRDHEVFWEKNGRNAIPRFTNIQPELCILDVMLPDVDGFSIAKAIRMKSETIPILFLTAKIKTEDVLKGFECGGNDYLKKPFSLDELYARIQELSKRVAGYQMTRYRNIDYKIGRYTFSPSTQCLSANGKSQVLPYKAARLLEELILNKNNVMNRSKALTDIWGEDNTFNARTMDVYITKLRKYLQHDDTISIINIRGLGYKLTDQGNG